jgi:hypothetical protein
MDLTAATAVPRRSSVTNITTNGTEVISDGSLAVSATKTSIAVKIRATAMSMSIATGGIGSNNPRDSIITACVSRIDRRTNIGCALLLPLFAAAEFVAVKFPVLRRRIGLILYGYRLQRN